jgi:hypothetical protein
MLISRGAGGEKSVQLGLGNDDMPKRWMPLD